MGHENITYLATDSSGGGSSAAETAYLSEVELQAHEITERRTQFLLVVLGASQVAANIVPQLRDSYPKRIECLSNIFLEEYARSHQDNEPAEDRLSGTLAYLGYDAGEPTDEEQNRLLAEELSQEIAIGIEQPVAFDIVYRVHVAQDSEKAYTQIKRLLRSDHGVSSPTQPHTRSGAKTKLTSRRGSGKHTASSRPEFYDHAKCQDADPEVFFLPKGGNKIPTLKICSNCDVSDQCREYALTHKVTYGIWGGLSERELRREQKNREAS